MRGSGKRGRSEDGDAGGRGKVHAGEFRSPQEESAAQRVMDAVRALTEAGAKAAADEAAERARAGAAVEDKVVRAVPLKWLARMYESGKVTVGFELERG